MKEINAMYFSWLALDSTNEEFTNEVASIIERQNNEWILNKVDGELREHVELLRDLMNTCSEEEFVELRDKIEAISIKLGILKSMVDAYEDNSNLANELEKDPGEVKVVFAKNTLGNVIAIKHIEEIEKYGDEKYEALLGLIERLQAGDTDFNAEKQRPLISSDKLKGIYELKDFQVRLIYMREGEYTVIIGACVKKDDKNLRYRSSLENMKKKSEEYRQDIRNGKLDMEAELKESSDIIESLRNGVKRGK